MGSGYDMGVKRGERVGDGTFYLSKPFHPITMSPAHPLALHPFTPSPNLPLTPSSSNPRLQSPAMKYFYGEYDGEEFPTQDKLFGIDQFQCSFIPLAIRRSKRLKAIEQMLKDPKTIPGSPRCSSRC